MVKPLTSGSLIGGGSRLNSSPKTAKEEEEEERSESRTTDKRRSVSEEIASSAAAVDTFGREPEIYSGLDADRLVPAGRAHCPRKTGAPPIQPRY